MNHSIFRLDSNQDSQESYIPLPIGSFYIGNNSFGYWSSRNKDEKRWRFFNAHVALKSSLKLKRENYLYSNFKHLQFIKNNFKKYLLNISKKKSTITKTSSKNSQKEIINISNIKKQLSYLWTFANNLKKRKMNHE